MIFQDMLNNKEGTHTYNNIHTQHIQHVSYCSTCFKTQLKTIIEVNIKAFDHSTCFKTKNRNNN